MKFTNTRFRHPALTLTCCTLLFVSSGCIGPKKINKWVKQQYGEAAATPVKKKSDYLSITSAVPGTSDRLSETTKRTHNVLPLLFYWKMDYDNTCTLNPQIPVNNFINTVTPYANKALRKKLNGQRIELLVEHVPNHFVVLDHGQLIWFVLYAYGWDRISIEPLDDNMIVSYKIFGADNSTGLTGSVTVRNTDNGVPVGQFQSVKRRTQEYLGDYNTAISNMSRTVIDQIALQLE